MKVPLSYLRRRSALPIALVLLAGCGVLEPPMPDAEPDIPREWPERPVHGDRPGTEELELSATADDTAGTVPGSGLAADIAWQDFFVDPRLEAVIGRALENNRDLRVAVLNVERARELYRIQRSDRLPSVGVTGSMVRTGGDSPLSGSGGGGGATGPVINEFYSVDLGITSFELDLFGRVRNLSESALQSYFAEAQGRRSAQLALVAEVANAWLTLAADRELLRVARATLETYEDSFRLTEQRHDYGAVSGLDVYQARTAVEAARSDVAFYTGVVEQDRNALVLLVGAPVDSVLLPEDFDEGVTGVDALPAAVPSEVLLQRPDVRRAEHRLRAANASIGAARAAFFPSISLTGAIGTASTELDRLFEDNTDTWSFTPSINLPIFQGGRLRANLGLANRDRDIALAEYERAIQAGFREVADALALTATLAEQRDAQEALVHAARKAEELSRARYEAGRDSYLVQLDAQRTLYSALQGLVSTRLAEQTNRVTLYKVLGGGL